jgi:hypothetical protein
MISAGGPKQQFSVVIGLKQRGFPTVSDHTGCGWYLTLNDVLFHYES